MAAADVGSGWLARRAEPLAFVARGEGRVRPDAIDREAAVDLTTRDQIYSKYTECFNEAFGIDPSASHGVIRLETVKTAAVRRNPVAVARI